MDYCILPDCELVYLPDQKISYPSETECCDESIAITTYLNDCNYSIASTFSTPENGITRDFCGAADEILAILTHREFNYQSKGRISHLLPSLRAALDQAIRRNGEIPIYLLYHGGYRAEVGGSGEAFDFTPGVTDILLLYQIARLRKRLIERGLDALRFVIVINNGVACYTNGVPYCDTKGYVARLRELIRTSKAAPFVSVLAQSELGDFEMKMKGLSPAPKPSLSESEHLIVERFLGRRCSREESCQRAAAYELAEQVWGEEIGSIVRSRFGLFCRQVAHPSCLSFRPFPGGAIRVQNGSVGFRFVRGKPVPLLVTSSTDKSVKRISLWQR